MIPSNVTTPWTGHEQGYTLVELLIAMALGLIVSLAAFSILEFTGSDVSRINNRAHVDQTGRVALEKIMLELHSACVAVTINPILPGSNENELKFISETSPLNTNKEPVSSLSTVRMHKIIYNKAEGTLTEKSWPSTAASVSPEYKFIEEAATEKKTKLLTGVKQTESTPIFQYYRYYQEGDTGVKLGQLNPSPMTAEALKKETESEKVAKVTASLTLAPEGKEGAFAKGDQPVALEDSAIFRLTPSSEAAGNTNLPCAQI
jgi:prepilin-type N-terminal cleavage/methylation domain-containing protein